MACENQIGVKNILITFQSCETEEVIRNVAHKLSTDELPTILACAWTIEALTNGYVSRSASNASITINVIRDTRVPLQWYQGCAQIDIQIEYLNGLVYTAFGGSVTGAEGSDTHDVAMEISFKEIDEMLPAAQIAA